MSDYWTEKDVIENAILDLQHERDDLQAELARRDLALSVEQAQVKYLTEIITRLKEDAERLASEYRSYDPINEITTCVHCEKPKEFDYKLAQYFYTHTSDCPITLHRALMKELEEK